MTDYSGDVRRGAVRIEVLVSKMRKQMEIDLVEYPNSKELALELKRIYENLLQFSQQLDKTRDKTDVVHKSIWDTAEPVKLNVINFKRS